MAEKRTKSKQFTGVYWRLSKDPTRKFNGKPDRAFDFCYRENGKLKWECAGWLSTGMSEQLAAQERQKKIIKAKNPEAYAEAFPEPAIESEPTKTFGELAENYFVEMEGENKHSSRERNRYKTHLQKTLDALPYTDIDLTLANKLKGALLTKMLPSSAKKCLSLCSAIFNSNRTAGIITGKVNPFGRESGFKMPVPQNKCERYLEPAEAEALLVELKKRSPQLHDLAYVSLHTGARSTELFSVCGGDIVITGGFFWTTAKGGSRHKVFASRDVLELMASYKRRHGEYIFQARGGRRLTLISDTFRRVAEELGLTPPTVMVVDGKEVRIPRTNAQKQQDNLKKVWFHTLRHTFASWLAQTGQVTLHDLRDLMRHESIKMTERYAHMIPDSIKEQSWRINEILTSHRKSGEIEDGNREFPLEAFEAALLGSLSEEQRKMYQQLKNGKIISSVAPSDKAEVA